MLCWACWFTNYSNAQELIPGQVYQTGNIVVPTTTSSGSTWIGAVYQDQLTCWSGGDPGYCGPQAIVRPGDNFNFSYGSTYVYQQQHINTILPAATGLQVNGYNFGFTAKNGNGWDDGRTDSLIALVRFWDNTGNKGANNLLYGTSYNLNSSFNWSTFNYSENFTKPLAATDVGLVQYGFIGRDNNGWAGPYGPELYGVNFSVKYSVDPCAANPLYSPTCKGYLDALAKLMPAATASTNTVVAEYAPPPESAPPPPLPPGEPVGSQPQSGPPPPPGAPPPPGQAPQQQIAQQTAPAATQASPQEKSSGAPANLGFALSLIAKNSEREKATAQQVVASAETQAQAAGDRAQATAQTTALAAVTQSTTSTEMGSSGTSIQVSGSSSRSAVILTTVQQQASTAVVLSAQSFTSVGNTQQNMGPQLQAPATFEQAQSTQTSSIFSTQEYRQQESEQVTQTANFLTDLNSPLKQILDAQQVQQAQQDQPQQSRNRDTTPNDLAVGVNLAQMATQPQGYANYTNFALKDASFYEIKEVYKNQKVVDNIRVLRGLGSDQKHQDLVNLQYK